MYRTIVNKASAKLNQKFVPKEFWADAMTTTTYICNKVTCTEIPRNQNPFELWTGRQPDLGLLRVF